MARYHLEHAHRTRNRVEDSLGCRSDSIAPTVDLVGGNMTRAFSDDLRSRVLAASRDGMSARSAAAWIASARVGQLTPAKKCRRGGSRGLHHRHDRRGKGYHAQRDGSAIA